MMSLINDSLCNTYINLILDTTLQKTLKDFFVYLDNEANLSLCSRYAKKLLVVLRNINFYELNLIKFKELFLAEVNSPPYYNCTKALRLFFCYLVKFNKYPNICAEDIQKIFSRKEYEEYINFLSSATVASYEQIVAFFNAVINSEPFSWKNDTALNSLRKIEDSDLQVVVENFMDYISKNNLPLKKCDWWKFLLILRNLKLSELNPKKFLELCNNEIKGHSVYNYLKPLRMFFAYLVKFEKYTNNNLDFFENIEMRVKLSKMYLKFIDNLLHNKIVKRERVFDFLKLNVESKLFLIHSYKGGNGTSWQFIPLNLSNNFIIQLLSDFCENVNSSDLFDLKFFTHFTNSYKEIENFTSISNFDYYVFEEQFKFFSSISYDCKRYIILFYIHLLNHPDGQHILKIGDPIDKNMMLRTDFAELYSNGYTLVLYNKMETWPTTDKWVICPNGYEYKSPSMRHNIYLAIDFSKIENPLYRKIAKEYLWKRDGSLATSVTLVSSLLTRALNFISNFKDIYINNSQDKIIYTQIVAADIYAWKCDLLLRCTNTSTFSQQMFVLRNFLNFSKDKSYLTIQNICFEYFKAKKKKRFKGGESISDEDLFVLQSKMLSIIDDSFENLLYLVIFHLLVETDIRISQLLNLKITDIQELMKKGQFAICTNTKVSHGEIVKKHISDYAKRHLDKAIEHTEQLRMECTDPDLKDCIFLTQSKRQHKNQIHTINLTAFNRFLSRHCNELGIKKYSTGNVRDTHMTKSREFIKKNNLSRVHESILTGHARQSTTDKHYIDKDIKTFVEASHGIIIGDVDIKGNILNEINTTYGKSSEVEGRCGFCKEDSCTALHPLLNCLLCSGIIVTLDRIPFFENKIIELDDKISTEAIQHEKEHLYTLKRLFCSYLARLYTLKEI